MNAFQCAIAYIASVVDARLSDVVCCYVGRNIAVLFTDVYPDFSIGLMLLWKLYRFLPMQSVEVVRWDTSSSRGLCFRRINLATV